MPSHRQRLIIRTILATLLVVGLLGALTGLLVLKSGWYNIGATVQHFQPVHTLLEEGMHRSVRHHARNVPVPPDAMVASPQVLQRGAALYRDNCVVCHGAPGVAQSDIGKSMQPVPGPLVDAAKRWRVNELYWITRNGIKMSGMPAWQYHLSESDIWAVVGFVGKLPALSPQAYANITEAAGVQQRAALPDHRPADLRRGQLALSQYACHACHQIPGVTGPDTLVGPPLADIAKRKYLAGKLPNTPANLALWIRAPQQVDPLSAMPALGVTESDARDMAAYLLDRP